MAHAIGHSHPTPAPTLSLIESRHGGRRASGSAGVSVSVLIHAAIIGSAILLTLRTARDVVPEPLQQKLYYAAPAKPAPPPPPPPLPAVVKQQVAKPTPPKPVVKTLPTPRVAPAPAPVPPKVIPTVSPAITVPRVPPITQPVTSAAASARAELSSAASSDDAIGQTGAAGGLSSGSANRAFSLGEVETPAAAIDGNPALPYPEALRSAGVEGSVAVEFIVGSNGRVERGSIRVLQSANPQFSAAVRNYLVDARYRPAKVGGKAVREVVQQSFAFRLNR